MDPGPNGGWIFFTLGAKEAVFAVLPAFESQGMPHDLNALKNIADGPDQRGPR